MCKNKFNGSNQTSKKVYSFIEKSNQDQIQGIGLFLIPDPERGILEFKKVAVPNLTFEETIKRGIHCEACKFIPFGYEMTFKEKTMIVKSVDDIDLQPCNVFLCSNCPSDRCFCSYLNGCI
ncbi:hypothetical protein ATE84_2919 [Aquimarina sp. MAR_2010_214]|nr:hypothetical protein ATE84_2919 [Aquimarina sp. MAR_2010_214]